MSGIAESDHGRAHGDPPALELEGVHIPFGEKPGLSGIDLTVGTGERFVLVGASGTGKSSLLRAIAGAGPMTSGRVRIDGKSVSGRSPRERGVVLLEQRPLLFPHFTVHGNVAFPLEVRGLPLQEIDRRVSEALEAVRLPELAGRMPRTLSGGQAHRVALARAVVSRPRVLLLDEPLTYLDPSLREGMERAIVEVVARFGTALLMVTHDLTGSGRVGERIGVLTDGRLAQVDTPAVLFREPRSLAVARFIGWRNELPVRVDTDGTMRVGSRDLAWPRSEASPGRPPSGAATLVFGNHGARLADRTSSSGLPVRITAVRHDPHGTNCEYRLDEGTYAEPSGVAREGAASDLHPPGVHHGEVAVDTGRTPTVGAALSLEILPSRARIFFHADSSGTDPLP